MRADAVPFAMAAQEQVFPPVAAVPSRSGVEGGTATPTSEVAVGAAAPPQQVQTLPTQNPFSGMVIKW